VHAAAGVVSSARPTRTAARARRKRGQDHLVIAVLARELDEPREHHVAHAFAAPRPVDVDREVRDEAIGIARVVKVEAAPAGDGVVGLGDDDRVAGAARGEPRAALVRRAQLGFERGDAVLDALVVDPADRGRVVGRGEADPIPVLHGRPP